MTSIDGQERDQRELQARLLWFRSDHPDAEIETELVVAEEEMAVCRATLRTASAGSAASHGSALRELAGAAYVEVAEDHALSRALAAMGYGTMTAAEGTTAEEDDDDTSSPYSPPIDLVSARSLLREEAETDEDDDSEPAPQPIRQSRPESGRSSEDTSGGDEGGDGADVSWNKFWSWARPRGYTSARELNALLGVDDVLAYTPREVRQMLVKYELENPPGGQEE